MQDDDGGSTKQSSGLAGVASAFQGGFKGGKDKTPKEKKQKQISSNATTTSPLIPGQNIPVFKKGGRVKKTGLALVHRGEYVVPAKRSRHKMANRKRSIIKA